MRLAFLFLLAVVCVSSVTVQSLRKRQQRATQSMTMTMRSRSNWYDTAQPAEFCGITTVPLDTAAFAQFETAWASAYGAKNSLGCGGQTARAVLDKIKLAMVAADARKDYSLFDSLAVECAADLTGGASNYALWSGGYLCSEIAQHLFHQTSLESTKFGKVLNAMFNWPTNSAFETAWKSCCGKMWNSMSVKFVDQMKGAVTVYFRFAGTSSVLYKQELPSLKKLFDAGTVTSVAFEVVLPDSAHKCGVRPGLRTVVTKLTHPAATALTDTLTAVGAAANTEQPGSVGVF